MIVDILPHSLTTAIVDVSKISLLFSYFIIYVFISPKKW